MKLILLILALTVLAGDVYAGSGWTCNRGDGSLVWTGTYCGDNGKFYAEAGIPGEYSKFYPPKHGSNPYEKCCNKKNLFGQCDIDEVIEIEKRLEKKVFEKVCSAREPVNDYPILIPVNKCQNKKKPCVEFIETKEKYYDFKK